MIATLTLTLLAATLSAGASAPAAGDDDGAFTVYADFVYTAAGDPIRGGSVTVSGGKIIAVTPSAAPEGALRVGAITPGMIDLSARVVDRSSVEQAQEVQPAMRVADALDPFLPAWKRLLSSGVTTVLVSPLDLNVIGGLAVVLKTGGAPSVAERTLKADAALRGSMGTMPSAGNQPARGRPRTIYNRRPTTRMGVEWEWRKAFYDTLAAEKDPERAFPGWEVLRRALDGELPVFVQAWATQDIRTAVFLKEEMARQGKPDLRLIIDAGAEAWREPDLLVRTGTPVVLPPFAHLGRTGDGAFMAWNVAKRLHDLGIEVALSGHGADGDAQLALQGAYARRGGLSLGEALAACTIVPARLIGVEDRVGSIEVGKDADLVLWSGEPFELTSRVVGVVLEGTWALDPRENGGAKQ